MSAAPQPGGYRVATGSLPVSPCVRARVEAAGFATRGDLENIGPVDLAREVGLTHEEALCVLKAAGARSVAPDPRLPPPANTLALLAAEERRRHIPTYCFELDGLLGPEAGRGGIAPCEVTELCAAPGLGKTQLCIQLAVNVQLPAEVGGLAGEAVYIDTEGSFCVERAEDMASATAANVRAIAASGRPELVAAAAGFTTEAILSRIHVFRAHDGPTQAALCASLPAIIAAHPRVKLIVLDSVAFHYRSGVEDYAARTRALASAFAGLMRLASTHSLAVVVTNQVTTRPGSEETGQPARLVPSLGESFAHAATTRLLLYWRGKHREAMLFKSPRRPQGVAKFAVLKEGIRTLRAKRAQPQGGNPTQQNGAQHNARAA